MPESNVITLIIFKLFASKISQKFQFKRERQKKKFHGMIFSPIYFYLLTQCLCEILNVPPIWTKFVSKSKPKIIA